MYRQQPNGSTKSHHVAVHVDDELHAAIVRESARRGLSQSEWGGRVFAARIRELERDLSRRKPATTNATNGNGAAGHQGAEVEVNGTG